MYVYDVQVASYVKVDRAELCDPFLFSSNKASPETKQTIAFAINDDWMMPSSLTIYHKSTLALPLRGS
jgi:hypothetical protein